MTSAPFYLTFVAHDDITNLSNSFIMSTDKVPDRYFTPSEVEFHNSPSDLWLSWQGRVYDLTKLSEEKKGI